MLLIQNKQEVSSVGKKFIILFTVAMLGCTLSCSGTQERTAYTGSKQIVAVPTFANLSKTEVSSKVLDSLTDKFATDLVKQGRFAVVERTRLNEILKEHELAMTRSPRRKRCNKTRQTCTSTLYNSLHH